MTILCYHAVQDDWSSPLAVSPAQFEAHVAWLVAHRTLLPVHEAAGRVGRWGRLPRGMAALTFDDGFRSVYDHALPLLASRRLPAAVFVVAGTIGERRRAVDWVDDPPQDQLQTLSEEQILGLHRSGVAIGSHSDAHHDLTELSDGDCEADLRRSREVLEDLLRSSVDLLAYPRGRHDDRVRRAAERAGFRFAFSLPERREPAGPFAVQRVGVYRENTVRDLAVKCAPGYLRVRTSSLYLGLQRLMGRGAVSVQPGT
jgi:peptidoglycan/xylan/chitin deacetylase (PgdA/CDA1 family)